MNESQILRMSTAVGPREQKCGLTKNGKTTCPSLRIPQIVDITTLEIISEKTSLYDQSGLDLQGREVRFDGGLRMHGWTIPAPVAVPGEQLYLELGLSRIKNQPDFRMVVFLTNGTDTVMQEVPPDMTGIRHDAGSDTKRWFMASMR